MSFTVKRVTQRASGGEIVRRSVIDKPEIIVGRGTDCDVQLTDLALNLRHARLSLTPEGRVVVEALGEDMFEVDKRFVARAELDPAKGARLVMGGHALTLAPGARPGEVELTVARVTPAEPAASLDTEARAMAPGRVGLSKRWTAWGLAVGLLLAGLAWPISAFLTHQNARIHADQQWSSGPLSKAHAFLGTRCNACHQKAFVAVRDEACLTCHRAGESSAEHLKALALVRDWGGPRAPPLRVAGDHADATRLLRATPYPSDWGGKARLTVAKLFNHPDSRCASCHREHVKPAVDLAPGHAKSPTPDKPALTVIHTCAECHTALKSRLPETDLVDTPSWSRHPEFRPVVAVSLAGPKPTFARTTWRPGLSDLSGLEFSHAQHLSVTNGVAAMALTLGKIAHAGDALPCESCHKPEGRGFAPVKMVEGCKDCHSIAYARVGGQLKELPHGHPDQVAATLLAYYARSGAPAPAQPPERRPAFWSSGMALPPLAPSTQAALAIRAAFSRGGACFGCHEIRPPAPNAPMVYGVAPVHLGQSYLSRGAFDHSLRQHRYAVDGKTLACASCHAAKTSTKADDLLVPGIASCRACHGKTKAQAPLAAGADCAECHSWHAPDRPEAWPAGTPDPTWPPKPVLSLTPPPTAGMNARSGAGGGR